MHLGLVTYNLGQGWDLDTLLQKCAALGYEGVEFRTTHAHGVEPTLTAAQRAEVRKKLEASGLKWFGLGTTCEYHSPDPQVVQQNIQTSKDFIDLAADIGAQGVKVRPNALPEGVSVEKTLRQIGEALKPVGDYAAAKGVEVYVEVHGRGTAHPPHMKTIMEVADHPAVGLCWNCNVGRDDVDGSIRPYFTLCRRWIRTVHIHDLAEPDYPWQELFDLLVETGFEGYTLVESPGSAEPERILTLIKALWELRLAMAKQRT